MRDYSIGVLEALAWITVKLEDGATTEEILGQVRKVVSVIRSEDARQFEIRYDLAREEKSDNLANEEQKPGYILQQ